jgi:hypothetical protein
VRNPTVFAVDWSGAQPPQGIWLVAIRDGDLLESRPFSTREAAVEAVVAADGRVVVGFDFSFAYPAWVSDWHGWSCAPDGWQVVERLGEAWLRDCPPPFWGFRGSRRPKGVELFRRCERRLRAKSTFQINGPGSVGKGAVRGMPFLRELRAAGFAIWPFDDATDRTVVEIYPSALRRVASDLDVGAWTCKDERDAVVSARVMWRHRESVAASTAATDAITRLEGDIWMPPATT